MSGYFFDRADEYDEVLNRGLRVSGEDRHYFMIHRVRQVRLQLPSTVRLRHILDFGCGIGDTTRMLAESFPGAHAVGIDTADKALERARSTTPGSASVSFRRLDEYREVDAIDLCYVNGVFHHIEPAERPAALAMIHDALRPGGYLAFFENNPWNPGTRLVMKRIPFDRDARPLTPRAARRLLRDRGFNCRTTRFLFYFPRALALLRFSEPWFVHVPLGAQYLVLAVK